MDSAINKKVSFLLIYFYRLTDTIDINQKVIIDNYRFIDWFSDIGFLAGIKCFSKTGLCKIQLKRGLQCQNGHQLANSCTHAPPHVLVIRQPITDILEKQTENQAHILLAEARQSNLRSGPILAVLIHSLPLFSFRLSRRNVITKRNEN